MRNSENFENVVHSLVVGFETRLKCLYNKPNFTSKHGLKNLRIASTYILNLNFFSGGGGPPNPPYERGKPPLVLSPARAFGPRRTPMAFNGRTTFPKPTTALVCTGLMLSVHQADCERATQPYTSGEGGTKFVKGF